MLYEPTVTLSRPRNGLDSKITKALICFIRVHNDLGRGHEERRIVKASASGCNPNPVVVQSLFEIPSTSIEGCRVNCFLLLEVGNKS
jgi:hypothetical protein